jgi:hypothetical protein
MRQVLVPETAKVIGTWKDGSAAVTYHAHGKGKAYAVGTLAGNSWMKTGVRVTPWARGGRHMLYNPTDFDSVATNLVRLGVDSRAPTQEVVCSKPGVEAIAIDHKDGTLLTLVNWTNGPVKDLQVQLRLPSPPKEVRSVTGQKTIASRFTGSVVSFTIDLDEGDFVLLPR